MSSATAQSNDVTPSRSTPTRSGSSRPTRSLIGPATS